jgi:hypothetical protein
MWQLGQEPLKIQDFLLAYTYVLGTVLGMQAATLLYALLVVGKFCSEVESPCLNLLLVAYQLPVGGAFILMREVGCR